ncbi:dephospho-CoA kinase, partial [uncultured Parasutterella sp.]
FWKQRISRLLVVDTPEEMQITRVMKRNGFSREEVMSILNAQASRTERLKSADDIIENVFSIKELKEAVHRLHTKYSSIDRELSISPAC